MAVMLALSAFPAMVMRSLFRLMPTMLLSSSCWNTHVYALSCVSAVSVRTTCFRRNLALVGEFDSNAMAPPMRNMQLGRSKAWSLPT